MKCPPLLPQVALVLAVAYACSDSAGPGNSRTLVAPTDLTGVIGKPPPPPVATSIAVTITSHEVTAIFTGVFFNNGLIHDDGVGSTETFDGTAWLRFDNKQPEVSGFLSGTTSANARFMVKDLNTPTGHGTLTVGGVDYTIVAVTSFVRFAGCGLLEGGPTPCAQIEFDLTDPDGGSHGGHLVAFDRSECLTEDGKGGFFYDEEECPLPDVGS